VPFNCNAVDLSGYDLRADQEILGHKDVNTTIVCARVSNRGRRARRAQWMIFEIVSGGVYMETA